MNIKTYQIIFLILFISSCAYDPGDARLVLVNNTKHLIAYTYNSDTIPEYPSINKTEYYLRDVIMISDSLNIPEINANWPRAIEKSKNKKLNLFIFDIDSLKKYKNIDTLIKRKIYKRLEYSEQELEKNNWIVKVKN